MATTIVYSKRTPLFTKKELFLYSLAAIPVALGINYLVDFNLTWISIGLCLLVCSRL
jgi:hypothetical protein